MPSARRPGHDDGRVLLVAHGTDLDSNAYALQVSRPPDAWKRNPEIGTVTISHIYRGVWPFVGLQLLCLIACMMFPAIVLWLPRSFGMF